MKNVFFDLDGTLAEWKYGEPIESIYEKGYFRNLQPTDSLVQLARDLALRDGTNVYILSCYPAESKYALSEKKEWCEEYLPEVDTKNLIFVPYGVDKSVALKERLQLNAIGTNDYLVDDHTDNLLEWSQAGGTPIKWLNGGNGTSVKLATLYKGIITGDPERLKCIIVGKEDL